MIRSTKKGKIGKGRSSYYEIVQIEIGRLIFIPNNKSYVIEVSDYAVTTNTDGSIVKIPIGTMREIPYPKEKINALFKYLNNPIEVTEEFSDDFYDLLCGALLYVTQTELDEVQDENGGTGVFVTNYELQPNEWFIIQEN
ncbi:hypothetical protein SAMN05421847_2200 [Halpernia humi]|uniref:Uncharacterized protein n=1 Tax=Halpernia humi TaxID=493375 RepID=A0A1H5ZU66_9FLAO|nr:hypothetical protein [Halpernia humi]SEG39702.1 hypothetical protein SAMN05421847_2200 [Halpernia humi]